MSSLITQTPAASANEALAHFSNRLRFETDCSDVYHSQQAGEIDYVLVDVRGAAAFAAGHVPGALSLPTKTITAERLAAFPADTLFVVYCAGPHCNGVHRAAVRLARLGYAVKEMIGGVTGWLDEGFTLANDDGGPRASTPISCAC
ncbi:rhodanese-like domain-containing protein [Pseudomonas sp. DTU_2021_1001937_2_SI_NGA_ILE_001]|uniref:rhodanese-like domain-containing protein n=1 Tax=Pseudomonas sp. DTU_2021_1001937_2_SI_NGA_ILE_001 TaxID=3077589 RepID=UPI0025D31F32|nr:rhodanese-like domain-containing protein [Pseudomonas sp. DTU_2021_1001937_2_SI_NGA_ILE_001]WNW09768.1 rhodanese-like domain-containing protein [Pseudomonas sp. DTU_2021_1001937_2_SI_NGA_ILE_001]